MLIFKDFRNFKILLLLVRGFLYS